MADDARNPQDALTMIDLVSSDKQVFAVSKSVAFQSATVKQMVEDFEALSGGSQQNIPLDNVTGPVLAKVIEYCKHQVPAEAPEDPDFLDGDADFEEDEEAFDLEEQKPGSKKKLSAFEDEYLKMEQSDLFQLMLAANYLNVKSLLELLIEHVAGMVVACKDAEEIRKMFHIANDLSAEEVQDIKKKHTWAFE